MDAFMVWCHAHAGEPFLKYFEENWLCIEWESGWLDMDRPHRDGIGNTNNSSESFFKTLLRCFLGGIGQRKPSELLRIVEENVFLYFENLISQRASSTQLKRIKTKNWIVEVNDDRTVYRITIKKQTAMVIAFRCDCPFYFVKGHCLHVDAVKQLEEDRAKSIATSSETTTSSQLVPHNKPGPKKAIHLPGMVLEDMVLNINTSPVTTECVAPDATHSNHEQNLPTPNLIVASKPGPPVPVASQRVRRVNIQPPIRFRNGAR